MITLITIEPTMTAKAPLETTNLDFAYEFHHSMRSQQLILAYEGDMTQQLTKAFSSLAEESLDKEQEDERVKRKVFHVMVESLQNVARHSHDPDTGNPINPGSGIVLVGKATQAYFVTTGNIVANDRIDVLRDRLNHINSLEPDELKKYYKEKLRASRLSDKGGAGLGFIDMAKKTGSDIEFQFVPVNEHASFFVYRIQISRN